MEVKEPAAAYGRRKYSVKDYLDIEDASDYKHEYFQGEIFAMSGAKLPHIFVEANIFKALSIGLDEKPCQPFVNDMRIYVEELETFFYPDISVVCGEPVTSNDDQQNVTNPTLIIEILSPSTKSYDQKEKFESYKHIASLREFILVEPASVNIEAYRIDQQGHWNRQSYSDLNESLQLESIDIALPLKDIYKRTKLINLKGR